MASLANPATPQRPPSEAQPIPKRIHGCPLHEKHCLKPAWMTVGSSMHCKRLWGLKVLITPPKGRPTKMGTGLPKVHTLVVDGPQSGAGSERSCSPATGLRRQKFLTAGHAGTIHESQQGLSSQIRMSPANTRSWGPSLKISAPGMRTAGQLCPPWGGRCVEGNGLILAKCCTSTITLGLMPSELHKVRCCEPDLPTALDTQW